MRRIIVLVMTAMMSIGLMPIDITANNGQPRILRAEYAEKELSQNKNNPSKLPPLYTLKFIGNDACKNQTIDVQNYQDGIWLRTGFVAKFDGSAEYSLPTGQTGRNPDFYNRAYAVKFVVFENNEFEKILTESPTYYIIYQDESSIEVDLADEVLTELKLTTDQLTIAVKRDYIFNGSTMLLKDKTTGKEQVLRIYGDNQNVSGILTNRIVYTNLSIDRDHIYEITIRKGAVLYNNLNNADDYRYTQEFVREVAVEIATEEDAMPPSEGEKAVGNAPVEDAKIFKDVPNNYWAYPYIKELTEKQIVSGYEDGAFRPEGAVTRSEFAKMMLLSLQVPLCTNATQSFVDMPKSDWAFDYIETVKPYLTGYQNGEDYYFKGSDPAVREDMAIALVKAMNLQNTVVDLAELKTIFTDYATISPNLQKYVLIAYKNQLISGYPDGTFGAQKPITRAEAAALLSKVHKSNALEKVTFD